MARTAAAEPELALQVEGLGKLISALLDRGYEVIGPTRRNGAITFDRIESLADLPHGWTDVQSPGRYRLETRSDDAVFGYNAGPRSLKNFLHPPEVLLYRVTKNGGFSVAGREAAPARVAFLGVRACDLHALHIQDRVLLGDRYVDDVYQQRRNGVFILAVQCTQAADTCFCASVGSGPKVESGYDVLLTEVLEPEHVFAAKAGSAEGRAILEAAGAGVASKELSTKARAAATRAERQKRRVEVNGLGEAIHESFDSPRWDESASGCLACGNCTQVCPTCFCTTVEDTSNVSQTSAERWRRWDSCFTESFSYIHGGSIRLSVKSRYRQRLLHKFAAWQEQFGTLGCTGCGRCTTWCPAGIDVIEELAAVRSARPASARVEETGNGNSNRPDAGVTTPPIC